MGLKVQDLLNEEIRLTKLIECAEEGLKAVRILIEAHPDKPNQKEKENVKYRMVKANKGKS